jgi:hypothetical protein
VSDSIVTTPPTGNDSNSDDARPSGDNNIAPPGGNNIAPPGDNNTEPQGADEYYFSSAASLTSNHSYFMLKLVVFVLIQYIVSY